MSKVTVLTPTYNRKEYLNRLYESLVNQTCNDFEWLIIDDGSVDDTQKLIESFILEGKVNIKYVGKDNGGKHTALNLGFSRLESLLTIIVDNDDYLVSDAIECIIKMYEKYKLTDKEITGFVFLKGFNDTTPLSNWFINDEQIEDYNEYVINQKRKGDKAEVFLSEVLKNVRFPEFDGEKFLAEGATWSKINHNKKMVFINKIIYIAQYLEDGLSKSGRKMRLNNPYGGRYHAEEYLDKRYVLSVRIKNSLLYNIYNVVASVRHKEKLKLRYLINYFTFLPSLIILIYWKIKGVY